MIKSIKVLATQFYTLLEMDDIDRLTDDERIRDIFKDEQKLADLKAKFVRHAIEELMRRNINKGEKVTDKILEIIHPEF